MWKYILGIGLLLYLKDRAPGKAASSVSTLDRPTVSSSIKTTPYTGTSKPQPMMFKIGG